MTFEKNLTPIFHLWYSRGLRGRLPRPPPISPRIIVRKCQSVTPTSSREDLKELPDDDQGFTEVRSVSESRKGLTLDYYF